MKYTTKPVQMVVLLLVALYVFSGCTFWHQQTYHPNSGFWYCDELNMQIAFGKNLEDPIAFYTNKGYVGMSDEEYYSSHIILNGLKYRCATGAHMRQPTLIITYDDIRYNDNNPAPFALGYEFFRGTAVKVTRNVYTVKEDSTQKVYKFVRIE